MQFAPPHIEDSSQFGKVLTNGTLTMEGPRLKRHPERQFKRQHPNLLRSSDPPPRLPTHPRTTLPDIRPVRSIRAGYIVEDCNGNHITQTAELKPTSRSSCMDDVPESPQPATPEPITGEAYWMGQRKKASSRTAPIELGTTRIIQSRNSPRSCTLLHGQGQRKLDGFEGIRQIPSNTIT